MTKPAPDETALLVKILADTPRLEDAACIGHHALFDPAQEHEPASAANRRHRLATELCKQCPVLVECRHWASEQGTYAGVIAGHIPPPPRPRGRPTKNGRSS